MDLLTYFKHIPTSTFKKGDIILKPGDRPLSAYYIASGYVRAYSLTEWGDEKLYIIYKSQEFFPIYYLFDRHPLTKFYEAFSDVTVKKASIAHFIDTLKTDHDLHFEYTKYLAAMMNIYLNRIDTLEAQSAYLRVVTRLVFLALRFGVHKQKKIVIAVPLTHYDIASSIALSRETVSREFEKLEQKELVGYENHCIIIYDIVALKNELTREK